MNLQKPTPLALGQDANFLDVTMSDKERSEHMHVIGATGSGKSRFLLSLIKQDIKAGRGLMLIDPHGELYDHIMDWLVKNERLLKRRKLRLIDPSDDNWSIAFNPLYSKSERKIPKVVNSAVSGLAHIMGGGNLADTPLMARSLEAICTALAYSNLSLLQAPYLYDKQYARDRKPIIQNIKNPVLRQAWLKYENMAEREFNEVFASAERRISPLITDPKISAIVGQTENSLDLKKSMDQGEIILVNFSEVDSDATPESSALLGRLLVNNLVLKSYERDPKGNPRPFTLYMDEAHNFLSSDVSDILAKCRKFGLHLVLAHQFLEQLREAGEIIYKGVMGTARSKVVFSLDDPDDARIMAERLFAGKISYEKPKQSMFKPAVVGHEIIKLTSTSFADAESDVKTTVDMKSASISIAEASSETEMSTNSTGSSSTNAMASGTAEANTFIMDESGNLLSTNVGSQTGLTEIHNQNEIISDSEINTESSGNASGLIKSKGLNIAGTKGENKAIGTTNTIGGGSSETLKPIIEWLPGQLETMEEQKQQFQDAILCCEERHAFVAIPSQGLHYINTLDVPDERVSKSKVARIKSELNSKSKMHTQYEKSLNNIIQKNDEIESFYKNDEETGFGYNI